MAPKKAPPLVVAVPKKAPPPVFPVPKNAPPPFGPNRFVLLRKWQYIVLKLRDAGFDYCWEAAKEAAELSKAKRLTAILPLPSQSA